MTYTGQTETPQERVGSLDIGNQKTSLRRAAAWFSGAGLFIVILSLMFFEQPRALIFGQSGKAVIVKTYNASYASFPRQIWLAGSIAAADPLPVGSSMSGLKIKSITADEGQYVKKGQTLATLDSSIIQAQLAAATARLEGSQASLEKAQQSKNSQDNADLQNAYKQALAAVADNQTLVDHAKADYKDAYAAAQKYKALLKQGTVSQEEVANQLNGARATAARLDTALAQLASSKSMAAQISERLHFSRTDTEKFDLAIARSAVAENKALVKQLQAQLAQTAITAPDDGLITRKDAHLGEISMPPKVLFEILGQGRLEARILVSQQDLNKIKIGDSVNITNDFGYTNGRVSYISQALEPSNRLAILRVEIPKSAPFKPGMSAKAGIKIAERTSIGIPPDAIISEGTKHYVYVAEKGQARKRPITIGEHHANQVEILKGLAPGSMVIKHADGSIRDGLKIRVADS